MGALEWLGGALGGVVNAIFTFLEAYLAIFANVIITTLTGGEEAIGYFVFHIPTICAGSAGDPTLAIQNAVPICQPGTSLATGADVVAGNTIVPLFDLVRNISFGLFVVVLMVAGISYLLESFSLMGEGSAASVLSGSVFALIMMFLSLPIFNIAAGFVNAIASDPGPILQKSSYILAGKGPITDLLIAAVNPCSLTGAPVGSCFIANPDPAGAFADFFLGLAFFFMGIIALLTLYASGLVRILLIGSILVMMPLLLILRLLPPTKGTADGLIETMMGLMITPIPLAIFVEYGYSLVVNMAQCAKSPAIPIDKSAINATIGGCGIGWNMPILAVASFTVVSGISFLTMITAPRAGKMIGKIADQVGQGVQSAAMMAGGMVAGAVGGAAGGLMRGGSLVSQGLAAAGGGAAGPGGGGAGRVMGRAGLALQQAGFIGGHMLHGAAGGGARGVVGSMGKGGFGPGAMIGFGGVGKEAFGAKFNQAAMAKSTAEQNSGKMNEMIHSAQEGFGYTMRGDQMRGQLKEMKVGEGKGSYTLDPRTGEFIDPAKLLEGGKDARPHENYLAKEADDILSKSESQLAAQSLVKMDPRYGSKEMQPYAMAHAGNLQAAYQTARNLTMGKDHEKREGFMQLAALHNARRYSEINHEIYDPKRMNSEEKFGAPPTDPARADLTGAKVASDAGGVILMTTDGVKGPVNEKTMGAAKAVVEANPTLFKGQRFSFMDKKRTPDGAVPSATPMGGKYFHKEGVAEIYNASSFANSPQRLARTMHHEAGHRIYEKASSADKSAFVAASLKEGGVTGHSRDWLTSSPNKNLAAKENFAEMTAEYYASKQAAAAKFQQSHPETFNAWKTINGWQGVKL